MGSRKPKKKAGKTAARKGNKLTAIDFNKSPDVGGRPNLTHLRG
jgi:hypothetical protein